MTCPIVPYCEEHPEIFDAYRLRVMISQSEEVDLNTSVDELLPDQILGNPEDLRVVAQKIYPANNAEAFGITGMHLACSTLSIRVLKYLLFAIGKNSTSLSVKNWRTINRKDYPPETLLSFIFFRHPRWKDEMENIILALLEFGYIFEDSDYELLMERIVPTSLKNIFEKANFSPDEGQKFIGKILDFSHEKLHISNVLSFIINKHFEIFHPIRDKPPLLVKLLRFECQRESVINWIHDTYKNQTAVQLFLSFKLQQLSENVKTNSMDKILDQLYLENPQFLLSPQFWLDNFGIQKHITFDELCHVQTNEDLTDMKLFCLWHLLPDKFLRSRTAENSFVELVDEVLEWLFRKGFDFLYSGWKMNSDRVEGPGTEVPPDLVLKDRPLFSALHFSFVHLKVRNRSLLERILEKSYAHMSAHHDESRDLQIAIMAENKFATEWILKHRSFFLLFSKMERILEEYSFYSENLNFSIPTLVQKYLISFTLTPLGVIGLNEYSKLLRCILLVGNENHSRLKEELASVMDFDQRCLQIDISNGQRRFFLVDYSIELVLIPIGSRKINIIDALLFNILENYEKRELVSGTSKCGKIIAFLLKKELLSFLQPEEEIISVTLQNLILLSEETVWGPVLFGLNISPMAQMRSNYSPGLSLLEWAILMHSSFLIYQMLEHLEKVIWRDLKNSETALKPLSNALCLTILYHQHALTERILSTIKTLVSFIAVKPAIPYSYPILLRPLEQSDKLEVTNSYQVNRLTVTTSNLNIVSRSINISTCIQTKCDCKYHCLGWKEEDLRNLLRLCTGNANTVMVSPLLCAALTKNSHACQLLLQSSLKFDISQVRVDFISGLMSYFFAF